MSDLNTARKYPRLVGIDILRISAAIWVACFHWSGGLGRFNELRAPYPNLIATNKLGVFGLLIRQGFIGVPIFFVISGFVLFLTTENRNPKTFFSARFSRLAPGYFISLIPIFAFIKFGFITHRNTFVDQFWTTLTLTSTPTQNQPLQQSYWSLWVEVCFYGYIFLGILFLKDKFKSYKSFFSSLMAILLTTAVFVCPGAAPFKGAFQIVPLQFSYYFLLGGSLALIGRIRNHKYWLLVAPALALSLVNLRSWIFSWDSQANGDWKIGFLIFGVVLLIIYAESSGFNYGLQKLPGRVKDILRTLGMSSYIFYLLQEAFSMPLISIFYAHIGHLHLVMAFVFIATLLISYSFSKYLEERLQRKIRRALNL